MTIPDLFDLSPTSEGSFLFMAEKRQETKEQTQGGDTMIQRSSTHAWRPPMWVGLLWILWLLFWWVHAHPVNVDVAETVHFGQWIWTHGRFPTHLRWVWGAPQSHWLAVAWEAGSAVVFAAAWQIGGPWGLFGVWAGVMTLTLGCTAWAIQRSGRSPAWGILWLGGVVISLFMPVVAAMWVLPGAAFVLADASRWMACHSDRWRDRMLYLVSVTLWAWLSPSVLWAGVLLGGVIVWEFGHRPRPWVTWGWRVGSLVVAVLTLPNTGTWVAAVWRYLTGAVVPSVPWPSVTGLLVPWPLVSLPIGMWIAGVLLVLVRARSTATPRVWWMVCGGTALMIWHARYYTPLSLWALMTLAAGRHVPTKDLWRGLTVGVLVLTGVFLSLGLGLAPNATPQTGWATVYPEAAWFHTVTRTLPPGHVWVPLPQGGVFNVVTGRAAWLDNRMQVWDASPRAYGTAAALATGRRPLGTWLRQERVVAVLWPSRGPLDARLRQAGWHVTGHGPGNYEFWRPAVTVTSLQTETQQKNSDGIYTSLLFKPVQIFAAHAPPTQSSS